ncbi:hypothetical protein Salat_0754700 [Sesamum alatum]|uniref:Uncharacterized protein n=1 Tax=Sesamum alatum TaxID=300844 RepID=A0AAE1YTH1_9LAMI|nr:hypothetical protein Salat_0754700 [Sesamum alatum]
MSVRHPPRSSSDYCPLLVQVSATVTTAPTSFRFQNMWCRLPRFLQVIAECWALPKAETAVAAAEREYDQHPTDANLLTMNRATALLQRTLSKKRAPTVIFEIKDDGNLLLQSDAIQCLAMTYF